MNMIDKDAVLHMIDINTEPHAHGEWDSGYNVALSEMREKIKQMPTIEAEPVNEAHWIIKEEYEFFPHCSECGFEYPVREIEKFCARCGRLMKEDN